MDHQIRTIIHNSIGVRAGIKSHLRRNQALNIMAVNADGNIEWPTSSCHDGKPNEDIVPYSKNANVVEGCKSLRVFVSKNKETDVRITPTIKDRLMSISTTIKELDYFCVELSRPQMDYTENGKVKVESKKDLKKRGIPSPNLADAFVMVFYTQPRGFF